jgi:hypothetical protein
LPLAPSSQEASFHSDTSSSPVPSVDDGGPHQEQVPVENLSMKAKVYPIWRELSDPDSISSPPRNCSQPSHFQSCLGLVGNPLNPMLHSPNQAILNQLCP